MSCARQGPALDLSSKEDELRLPLPLQTIEDREHVTITIEQG